MLQQTYVGIYKCGEGDGGVLFYFGRRRRGAQNRVKDNKCKGSGALKNLTCAVNNTNFSINLFSKWASIFNNLSTLLDVCQGLINFWLDAVLFIYCIIKHFKNSCSDQLQPPSMLKDISDGFIIVNFFGGNFLMAPFKL